jgi:hypothetical protein
MPSKPKGPRAGHKPPLWCAHVPCDMHSTARRTGSGRQLDMFISITSALENSNAVAVADALRHRASRADPVARGRSEAKYGSAHGEWESQGLLAPGPNECVWPIAITILHGWQRRALPWYWHRAGPDHGHWLPAGPQGAVQEVQGAGCGGGAAQVGQQPQGPPRPRPRLPGAGGGQSLSPSASPPELLPPARIYLCSVAVVLPGPSLVMESGAITQLPSHALGCRCGCSSMVIMADLSTRQGVSRWRSSSRCCSGSCGSPSCRTKRKLSSASTATMHRGVCRTSCSAGGCLGARFTLRPCRRIPSPLNMT